MSGPVIRDDAAYWNARLAALDAQRAALIAGGKADWHALNDISLAEANAYNQLLFMGGPLGVDVGFGQ